MLFWHKHDLEKAVIDLANFTPYPDEWTKEEKALFAQAFQFHGKCFYRIRQMVRKLQWKLVQDNQCFCFQLPDKSIASLVKFYYSWKKTRIRVLERQEKKKKGESENGSPDESDVEEKVTKNSSLIQQLEAYSFHFFLRTTLTMKIKWKMPKPSETSTKSSASQKTKTKKEQRQEKRASWLQVQEKLWNESTTMKILS